MSFRKIAIAVTVLAVVATGTIFLASKARSQSGNPPGIWGYVYDASENPLSNQRMDLYNSDHQYTGTYTYTNQQGMYSFATGNGEWGVAWHGHSTICEGTGGVCYRNVNGAWVQLDFHANQQK